MNGDMWMITACVFCVGLDSCEKKSTEPPTSSDFLNISGSWFYDATFSKGDSIWYIDPVDTGVTNLEITCAGKRLAGTFMESVLRSCIKDSCFDATRTLGGKVEGTLEPDNKITFSIIAINQDTIKHTGLVNVIRTDLPAGTPLRMTMNGTAVMERDTLDNAAGFFSSDRLVYREINYR